MDGFAPHRVEKRGGPRDVVCITPCKDQQRALFRVFRGSADGGVDHPDAKGRQAACQAVGHFGGDRAHVDEERVGTHCRRDRVLTKERVFHIRPVGEHRDHHITARCGLCGAFAGAAAMLRGSLDRSGGDVEGPHLVTCLDKVPGHGMAHAPKSDKADSGHAMPP